MLEKRTELQRDLYLGWEEVVSRDGHGGISRDFQLLTSGTLGGSTFYMSGASHLTVISFWPKSIQNKHLTLLHPGAHIQCYASVS